MILHTEPLGILSTRQNRFKLFYPHPTQKETHDLIIIIAIDKDETIIGLTVYEQKKSYREGIQ